MNESQFIDRATFETRLSQASTSGDAVAGFFGPQSRLWAIHRESCIFLGAGAALLLQLAHPWVARAITEHSNAVRDPLARYYRTFRPVFAMVYGTKDQALTQARRVRAVHEHISAREPGPFQYQANEANALTWVHETLWHTAMSVHERMFQPLSTADKNAYLAETHRFAALFGIPAPMLQPDWEAFRGDFAQRARALTVSDDAKDIAAYFIGKGAGAFGRFLPNWYRVLTASLLPREIAQAFGLPDESNAAVIWKRVGGFYRALPSSVRHVGPYQEAMRRVAGRNATWWIFFLNRFWLGRAQLEPRA